MILLTYFLLAQLKADQNHFIQACLPTQADLYESMKVARKAQKYDKMSKQGEALNRLLGVKQALIADGDNDKAAAIEAVIQRHWMKW